MDPRHLSDAQLAGQRLIAGFSGMVFDAELRTLIAEIKVGGLIFFKRNIVSPEQLAELCRRAQECARACGQPPLILAIDQEGGDVARLPPPFAQFPGPPFMKDLADAERFAATTAAELAAAGITTDLAPVLDVAVKEVASVMARRAFGSDPQRVTRMGMAVIDGLQSRGIMAVAKHFPGIGRTTLDSHLDRPRLDAAGSDLEDLDLVPFRAAIGRGVSGIMLAHVVYADLDPAWPASLSVKIARELLRGRLGYGGVVYSDDLEMGAITRHYPLPTVMERILAADVDLALICHSAQKQSEAFEQILGSLAGSAASRRRARISAGRILSLKAAYRRAPAGPGSGIQRPRE